MFPSSDQNSKLNNPREEEEYRVRRQIYLQNEKKKRYFNQKVYHFPSSINHKSFLEKSDEDPCKGRYPDTFTPVHPSPLGWIERWGEGGTCASESSREITGKRGGTPRQRLQPFALSLTRTATFGQM